MMCNLPRVRTFEARAGPLAGATSALDDCGRLSVRSVAVFWCVMSDLVNDPGAAVTQNDKTQSGQPVWPAFVIALAMLATLLWTGTVLWLLSRMPWFVSLLGVVATFSLVAAIAYDKFGALSRVVASPDDETAEFSEPYYYTGPFSRSRQVPPTGGRHKTRKRISGACEPRRSAHRGGHDREERRGVWDMSK